MEKYLCPSCMREFTQKVDKCPICGYVCGERQPSYVLPLGTTLKGGQYQVGKQQGHGGFGITYAALDMNLNRRVAIKEFYQKDCASRDGTAVDWDATVCLETKSELANFQKEAQKLSQLDDVPGIVRVYDVFSENNTSYMVMNFVEGETLQRRIEQKGVMEWEECYNLLRPLMEALAEVHRQQIVHRDISPDNIIINAKNRAILVDFGIAKDLNPQRTVALMQSKIAFKIGFSPPEQYETHQDMRIFGPWTDIYALCATLFYCLTRKYLPDGRSRRDYPEMLHLLFPDGINIDPQVKEALQKGLAVDPEDRYQDMEQLIFALDQTVKPVPEQGTTEDGISWTLLDHTLILSGSGAMDDISWAGMESIDSVIIQNGITSIEDYAFDECTNLTNVIIPNSVTYIGENAFSGCTSLVSVVIPNSVTFVGESAFSGCTSLIKAILSNKMTSIERCVFDGCESLVNLTIPDGVASIKDNAFHDCANLISITIPDSVTSIEEDAFRGCRSLISIIIPNGVTSIEWGTFAGCVSLSDITIPNSVTSIKDEAFRNCISLTHVTIPSSVKFIAAWAFEGCNNLTSMTMCAKAFSMHECVTGIVHYGCKNLTNIIIPRSVIAIEDFAFCDFEGLTNVSIPDGVISIGKYAFRNCRNLTSIIIPDSVTFIGESAFDGCESLSSITIPRSVVSIGEWAFDGCENLTNVTIHNMIFISAFYLCENLTSITISHGVTSIEDCDMQDFENLTDVTILDSVTSIGKYAFRNCKKLTSIIIPDSVTFIEEGAFTGCINLKNVSIPHHTMCAYNAFDDTTMVIRR